MENLNKESIVRVNGNAIKISEVLHPLSHLTTTEMLAYFQNLGVTFPRTLRMSALRETLNDTVKNETLMNEILTDEERYRLRWYEGFSEHQLVNLLQTLKSEQLFVAFRETLWLSMLSYLFEKGVGEAHLNELFEAASGKDKTTYLGDSLSFNNDLNVLFYDEPNTLDGLKPGIFRPILYKCSTLVEIREIGAKYDVIVPRRLKKAELVEIIKEELHDRNELNEELEAVIDGMNVVALQRFAINNNVKASIELKKEEIIEYILKNAKATTEAYFKPIDFSEYEVVEGFEHLEEPIEVVEVKEEVVEVKEEPVKEEIIEEPVKEEVIEVKEEPVVEEKGIKANQINVIFPYIAAVKKKRLRQIFINEQREDQLEAKEKEEKLKDAVAVSVVD